MIFQVHSRRHGTFDVTIDDEDAWVTEVKWHIVREKNVRATYVGRSMQATPGDWSTKFAARLHRVIMNHHDPSFPIRGGRGRDAGPQIDHIDGDGLNNQKSNLRIVLPFQNAANSQLAVNNTSGFKGVFWDKEVSRWKVEVGRNPKVFVGRFDCPIEAARAYDAQARKMYGEHALTNESLGLLK